MRITDPQRAMERHHAGEQLLLRYQRLVDAKDVDGLAGLVTDDVLLRRRGTQERGREAFLDLYRRFAASDVITAQHMASNVEVSDLDAGADDVRIRVDACFLAITTHGTGEGRIMWGRYCDDMVSRDGDWLIDAKRIDLIRTAFVEESALASPAPDSFGPRAAWSTDA